jgi:uncharacterized protein involved in type VI secretion and phage assembly
LREHGITHRARLVDEYPRHAQRIEYDESDLAFAERILFEEGVFYFFDHPPAAAEDDPDATNLGTSEVLVLCDAAAYYPQLAVPRLVHRGSATGSGASGDATSCFDASRRRRLRPAAGIVRGSTVATPRSILGDGRDQRAGMEPLDGEIMPVRSNSWATMYWNDRYRMRGDEESGLRHEEYIIHHDLEGAMAL